MEWGVRVITSKMSALQGEAHFFEESMNPMKVKEYLSRPKVNPVLNENSSSQVQEESSSTNTTALTFQLSEINTACTSHM